MTLPAVLRDLSACRICRDAPRYGAPLPHEPRPVIQASPTARICIAGQAPGTRVHASGRPFTDPSGDRLRDWLGLDVATFYDASRIAIVPMGHCFPGLDAKGGDRPPRRECAETWRARVFAGLPDLELVILVGSYAVNWHLPGRYADLTAAVADFRHLAAEPARPLLVALPHPSWRNNSWLKRNQWFVYELLPVLRGEIARILGHGRED